jgi:N-acetylglucosamine kinase-like BadF-type ATPase
LSVSIYGILLKNKKLIVGIDAGGTNIRIAIAERGGVFQEATPTIVNAAEDGGPEPLKSLLTSAGFDRNHVVSVAAGITKVSRTGIVDRWESLLRNLFPSAALRVVPDFQIAFHGAVPGGIGVGALAGTGAVMYGENAAGATVRVGGRGWEYGDEGSGAWLTTEAIRRTLRGLDGMEEMTPLCCRIGKHLNESTDAGKLGEAARRITQEQGRGFLVPLLVEQAMQSDTEAINLFVGAAGWLGAQVKTTLRRLEFEASAPVTIARMGGLWDVGPLLTDPFALVMARWYPEANLIPADAAPIVGALRLAEQGLKPH